MRLLGLFGAVFSMSLRREFAFRANLTFQIFLAATSVAAGFGALALVYARADTLAGWTRGEAIVLLGTFLLMTGMLATFIEPNMTWFAEQVRDGRFDEILLKPVPSILLASLGSHAPLRLCESATGVAMIGLGLHELGNMPSIATVAGWIGLLAAGAAIVWATRVLLASLALWIPALELDVAYGAVWQFGRYPINIYRKPVQFIFIYIVPIASVSTFPACTLVRGVDIEFLILSLGAGAGTIAVAWSIWNAGLRHYTSASS